MSMMEWTVIIAGLSAIAWVNWYFFLAQASADNQVQKHNVGIKPKSPR